MGQCILHLIRHGQTAWNAEKRLQGHVDIPLNEVGLDEARNVALEFKGRSLGGIYSSPLQRAHGTAEAINQFHDHHIKFHDALKESTYGSLDGIGIDEYHLRCQKKMDSFHQMSPQERLHFKLVEDAESYFEVYQRVRPVLDQIAQSHLGEEVIVVSHGGLMRAVIAMLAKVHVSDIHIQNTGCLTLVGDGSQLMIQGHRRIKITESL